jgi:hypothetical protein
VGWLDSNAVRALGYLAVAVAAYVAGRREQRRAQTNSALWPTFWFLTAGLFLVMALGRAGNVAQFVAELGREEAVATGWYANRRKYQALAVGLIALTWFIVVFVAIWRVPDRRRYLPMALVSFSLVCFAAIRMLSLHQVDALLYRRHVVGAEIGAVLEVLGLVVAFATTFWQPRSSGDRPGLATPAVVAREHRLAGGSPRRVS